MKRAEPEWGMKGREPSGVAIGSWAPHVHRRGLRLGTALFFPSDLAFSSKEQHESPALSLCAKHPGQSQEIPISCPRLEQSHDTCLASVGAAK